MEFISHSELTGLILSVPELLPLSIITGLHGDLCSPEGSCIMRIAASNAGLGIAWIEVPELDRLIETRFTGCDELMGRAIWYPDAGLRMLIAVANRVVQGRRVISDAEARELCDLVARERDDHQAQFEELLMDPARREAACSSLAAAAIDPGRLEGKGVHRALHQMAFCRDLIETSAGNELELLSSMIDRARHSIGSVTPAQREWIKRILVRSVRQLSDGGSLLSDGPLSVSLLGKSIASGR